MTNYEWDDNEHPLAYLITLRTFGTWLHGDERLSVDRHGFNIYGTPRKSPDRKLQHRMEVNIKSPVILLDGRQRSTVEGEIHNVCSIRGFQLLAINIRTNHVHVVVSACVKPETIMNAFKANATRELRAKGLIENSVKIWSRGGSCRYLWKPRSVEAAIEYVLYGQGDDLPSF